MARRPRLYVESCAQHIVQRGNNRNACFYTEADYAFYLQQLKEVSEKYKVDVHAFVLMTNHVHLLVTPSCEVSVSRMMQSLGRSYVRYMNLTYQRTGTLWEGRFKSSIVDSENYLLTVYRYIELNPVRAKMVALPGEYPWSSYRHNAMGVKITLINEHRAYFGLGETESSRLVNYRSLFESKITKADLDEIRVCTNKEWIVGSEEFKLQIESNKNRKINDLTWGGDRKSKRFKSSALPP